MYTCGVEKDPVQALEKGCETLFKLKKLRSSIPNLPDCKLRDQMEDLANEIANGDTSYFTFKDEFNRMSNRCKDMETKLQRLQEDTLEGDDLESNGQSKVAQPDNRTSKPSRLLWLTIGIIITFLIQRLMMPS